MSRPIACWIQCMTTTRRPNQKPTETRKNNLNAVQLVRKTVHEIVNVQHAMQVMRLNNTQVSTTCRNWHFANSVKRNGNTTTGEALTRRCGRPSNYDRNERRTIACIFTATANWNKSKPTQTSTVWVLGQYPTNAQVNNAITIVWLQLIWGNDSDAFQYM